MVDYCSSKFAAIGIHEALKTELRSQGHGDYIKTTVVCPYFINTGMFDGVTTKVKLTSPPKKNPKKQQKTTKKNPIFCHISKGLEMLPFENEVKHYT